MTNTTIPDYKTSLKGIKYHYDKIIYRLVNHLREKNYTETEISKISGLHTRAIYRDYPKKGRK